MFVVCMSTRNIIIVFQRHLILNEKMNLFCKIGTRLYGAIKDFVLQYSNSAFLTVKSIIPKSKCDVQLWQSLHLGWDQQEKESVKHEQTHSQTELENSWIGVW